MASKPSVAELLKAREEAMKQAAKEKALENMITGGNENLPKEGTQPEQEPDKVIPPDVEPGTDKKPDPQPQPETQPNPQLEPGTDTGTVMGTDMELQQFLKPSDNYIRKVYYPLDYQEEYIKKKAKKYKKTESEILRFLLDFAIKNGKI